MRFVEGQNYSSRIVWSLFLSDPFFFFYIFSSPIHSPYICRRLRWTSCHPRGQRQVHTSRHCFLRNSGLRWDPGRRLYHRGQPIRMDQIRCLHRWCPRPIVLRACTDNLTDIGTDIYTYIYTDIYTDNFTNTETASASCWDSWDSWDSRGSRGS